MQTIRPSGRVDSSVTPLHVPAAAQSVTLDLKCYRSIRPETRPDGLDLICKRLPKISLVKNICKKTDSGCESEQGLGKRSSRPHVLLYLSSILVLMFIFRSPFAASFIFYLPFCDSDFRFWTLLSVLNPSVPSPVCRLGPFSH